MKFMMLTTDNSPSRTFSISPSWSLVLIPKTMVLRYLEAVYLFGIINDRLGACFPTLRDPWIRLDVNQRQSYVYIYIYIHHIDSYTFGIHISIGIGTIMDFCKCLIWRHTRNPAFSKGTCSWTFTNSPHSSEWQVTTSRLQARWWLYLMACCWSGSPRYSHSTFYI